ncbi:hypothetical protein SDC9_87008 [bioreactor metagenome]|uniref:Uncharacterized protein n=1 Tax=bioreactor metagenome TaxID=1076179 RepID=A0A644ZJ56_9ZZZZ
MVGSADIFRNPGMGFDAFVMNARSAVQCAGDACFQRQLLQQPDISFIVLIKNGAAVRPRQLDLGIGIAVRFRADTPLDFAGAGDLDYFPASADPMGNEGVLPVSLHVADFVLEAVFADVVRVAGFVGDDQVGCGELILIDGKNPFVDCVVHDVPPYGCSCCRLLWPTGNQKGCL